MNEPPEKPPHPRPLKITPTGSQKRRWVWASKQANQRLTAWAAEALDDAAEVAAEEAGGFPFELPIEKTKDQIDKIDP